MKAQWPWLRLYNEARTDAKLESLPDDEFRVWHRLLCFANEQPKRGVIARYTPRLLAVEVARGDVTLLERTLNDLQELRIIETHDGDVAFARWDERQYDKPSDTPERVAGRVAAHRERQRNAEVTPGNAEVTLCNAREGEGEGESEAETERELPVAGGGSSTSPARARVTTTATTAANPDDWTLEQLCEQVAQRAHLGQRTEILEQLGDVLSGWLGRGLSPGDVWRDVQNLMDPSRRGHTGRPSITQISNWLAKREAWREQQRHDSERPDGHRANTSHGKRPLAAVAGGRRVAILPDPDDDGRYADRVKVASDDGPDVEDW